jgi:hypothetical protein
MEDGVLRYPSRLEARDSDPTVEQNTSCLMRDVLFVMASSRVRARSACHPPAAVTEEAASVESLPSLWMGWCCMPTW